MKRFTKLLSLLLLSGGLQAQMASAYIHEQMADSVVSLFNAKRFAAIYHLTTPEFRSDIKEEDVVKLLEKSLYNPLGRVMSREVLREDTGFYAFVLNYAGMKIQMNLGVNTAREIAFLQFFPYKPVPTYKREAYATDNKKQSGLDSLVDATLQAYMQSPQNCGISIGVISKGSTVFYNYGETKRGNGKLPSENTIYEIGSISKTFCGLLLAHAVREKKIKMEDDIRRYLPGKYIHLELNGKAILVKHLVSHTAGLPRIPENMDSQPGYDPLNPYKNYSKTMLLDYLHSIRPATEPGTALEYSNLGMALLGILLEEVYGKSFEALVKEKISQPLGMKHTGIVLSDEQTAVFAQGYKDTGEETPHWNLGDLCAAGGIRSSPGDMMKYLAYNLAEPDSVCRLSHQPVYSSGRDNAAMSWFIKQTKSGNTLMWHNGGTYGFSSFCGFIREKKCAVLVLANSGTNVDFIGIAILNYLQK